MHTVAETPIFQKYAKEIWSEDERMAFIEWIAANPCAGDVIPGSGGCRKVRWSRSGMGKRGGARVIYFRPPRKTVASRPSGRNRAASDETYQKDRRGASEHVTPQSGGAVGFSGWAST